MMSYVYIALAGIWPLIGYFGAGGALLVACLAAAWFSPVFKKEFLWGAGVIGAFLIAFATGVVTGEKRVRAQWTASVERTLAQGDKAHAGAVRDVARKSARGMRDNPDRYRRD